MVFAVPIMALRAVQFIFCIIVLGLTAYVADWWSGNYHYASPSQDNFLLFTSIWTILALIYLILAPLKFPNAAHKFAVLAVEALTMLFWFAAFIAFAVFLSNRACWGRVCSAAKAGVVFAAFEWLLFAITTALAALHVFRSKGTRNSAADPNTGVHNGV